MTYHHSPPRQPLFWAALAFSVGIWIGARGWRPPSWWVIAVVAFVFAASWFLRTRAWLAGVLSLGAWFLLGAFLIQVRAQRSGDLRDNDARVLALADGRPVILTARVMREGYAQAAGSKSVRETIDVETEEITSQGESWPLRTGVRLSIYKKVDDGAIASSRPWEIETRESPVFNDPIARSPDHPIPLTYGTRLR